WWCRSMADCGERFVAPDRSGAAVAQLDERCKPPAGRMGARLSPKPVGGRWWFDSNLYCAPLSPSTRSVSPGIDQSPHRFPTDKPPSLMAQPDTGSVVTFSQFGWLT